MANKYSDWATLGKRFEEIAYARAVEEAKATFGLTEGASEGLIWAGVAEALSGSLGTGAVEIAAHEAEADPHTGYQLESAKGAASGYASLDASTKVPIAQIPTGSTSSTVCLGNDSRLSDARTPLTHTHDDRYFTEAEVTTSLAGKADTGHNHDASYYLKAEVDAALALKAASSHSHDDLYFTEGEVTSLLSGKSDTSHTHDTRYYTETEVDTALALKSDTGHTHAAADIVSGTIALARIPTGTTASTVSLGNHSHDDLYFTEAEVTTFLAGKSDTGHTHSTSDISTGVFDIARIPTGTTISTVALGSHSHNDLYYTELEVENALALKASTSHTHPAADIVSGTIAFARLPTGTTASTVSIGDHAHDDRYYTEAEMTTFLDAKAASTHVHSGADITSGTVDILRLPTGTTSTQVALGNHVHAGADITSGTVAFARLPTGTTSSTVAIGNHTHSGVYEPVFTTLSIAKGGTGLSAVGTAGQYLRVNAIASGLEYDNGDPEYVDAGNSGTSKAIDWASGSVQKLTLTGNCTVTFSNPVQGGSYVLVLVQDATGGRTVTLTGWDFGDNTPTYNTGASKKNVVAGFYDGTEYLAVHSVKGA